MIAIVEDDNSIRELVCYTLKNTGFEACGYENGKTFFNSLSDKIPEILLLDIMLPGEDGITILKKLKANERTRNIPVIMLTAKSTEYDKVIGLDSGADDYIAKPFGMMELVSRIKAVLRRCGKDKKSVFTYKTVTLDTNAHTVSSNGNFIELTLKEYSLLQVLLENKGKVMTRDLLLQKIWGYDFDGETRTVDVHIRTLRTKLCDDGEIIETIRGVGYRIGGASW